jgi:hypothetical protein
MGEKDAQNPEKKKRNPSQWNLFLKDCAPKQPKDKSFGDKIKSCALEYQEHKKKSAGTVNNGNNVDTNGTNKESKDENK